MASRGQDRRPEPRERLIVALDVPTPAEARTLAARLGQSAVFYKIGLQLALAGGLDLIEGLASQGSASSST